MFVSVCADSGSPVTTVCTGVTQLVKWQINDLIKSINQSVNEHFINEAQYASHSKSQLYITHF